MSAILDAVEKQNLQEVKRLIESDVNVHEKHDDGYTVIHYAVSRGSQEIVEYLVEHAGADINCKNAKNETALHTASYHNIYENVKCLVQHGADVNLRNTDDCSPLHFAAALNSFEIVKYLVEHGADIHCRNKGNNTALHIAACSGSLEIVKYLTECGADVNCKNDDDNGPLYYAAKKNSLEIVKYLVEHGADVHCKNVENNTALHVAAQLNSLEMIDFLVKHGADVDCQNKNNDTALSYAVKTGSLEVVKYLVEHGANVNYETGGNGGPLHNAVKECKESSLDMVRYLVEHGANVNFTDDWNRTALHYAVELMSLETVKSLVEHGVDVCFKDNWNTTALHNAAKSKSTDSLSIVKYLVERGANVNSKTKRSATALHFAVSTGSLEIVEYLVENGAKVTTKQHRGEKTVLYWACRKGNESIVEFLLQHGAKEDVHDHDSFGRSCFGKVCYEGNTSLVRTFLKCGIDIRREAELLCHNNEIANMLRLELLKSTKHREKVEKLKALGEGDLTQVGSPLKRFCTGRDFSLGKGSGGTHVYVGIMEDDSLVAVKRILQDNCQDLAENENTILNLIKTEHSQFVVKYRGFLKKSSFMYLILDLCEESLDEHVKSNPIEYLRHYGPRMIKQIFSGLKFLHDHNILHRDLKPLNVLVDITGRMRLADFGLSRVLDDDQTTCYTFAKGTKNWMPPEVIEAGNVDDKGRYKKKSDVYVAGMIAFFILTKGKHPFGDQHARMTNILNGKPLELRSLKDLEAEDFISLLIRHNIDERPYAGKVVDHPFLNPVRFYEELFLPRILLVHDSD